MGASLPVGSVVRVAPSDIAHMSTSTRGNATTASSGRGASQAMTTPAGVANVASRRAASHGCREIDGSETFIARQTMERVWLLEQSLRGYLVASHGGYLDACDSDSLAIWPGADGEVA